MIDFVGAGPGAKDLITVRGMELIGGADVIVYTGSLVNPELLEYASEGTEIYDSSGMELKEIMSVMINAHKAGKRVVRLHTGDPALYGAIGEQIRILEENRIEYGYCPGVSSLFGAASALKKEFTVPGGSQTLIITRMKGRTEVPEGESIRSLSSHHSSMAVFLSAGMIRELSDELMAGGYGADSPAAIVYKATWEDERVIYTTVKELPEAAEKNGISKTAIIFTGDFLSDGAFTENVRSKLYAPAGGERMKALAPSK